MKEGTAPVTAFDWQSFTARPPEDARRASRTAARRAKKKLSVRERVERILAARWGNPYCKPGAA